MSDHSLEESAHVRDLTNQEAEVGFKETVTRYLKEQEKKKKRACKLCGSEKDISYWNTGYKFMYLCYECGKRNFAIKK